MSNLMQSVPGDFQTPSPTVPVTDPDPNIELNWLLLTKLTNNALINNRFETHSGNQLLSL